MAKVTFLSDLEKRAQQQEYALAARMIKGSGIKSREQLEQADSLTMRNMRNYKKLLSQGITPRGNVMQHLLKLRKTHALRTVISALAKSAHEDKQVHAET